MVEQHPVTALPWYARADYPVLLRLLSDPDMLPATYDAWLKRAERTESQMQKAGLSVVRVWIRPIAFAAWCKERNVSPNQAARLTFVNWAAHEAGSQNESTEV